MKIAICEDELVQANIICQYVKVLQAEYPIERIQLYQNGELLLKDFYAGNSYDIYLLDIMLPGINGLEIAALLARQQPDACTIFITSYTQYVTQAFSLGSSQYFTKPIQSRVFLPAMRSILSDYLTAWLTFIPDNERAIQLRRDDIVYVEFYHGKMIIKTLNDSYEFYPNVKEEKIRFLELGFLKAHQGYFVNPIHICSILEDTVICTDHNMVPISIRCYKTLVKQFQYYLNTH